MRCRLHLYCRVERGSYIVTHEEKWIWYLLAQRSQPLCSCNKYPNFDKWKCFFAELRRSAVIMPVPCFITKQCTMVGNTLVSDIHRTMLVYMNELVARIGVHIFTFLLKY